MTSIVQQIKGLSTKKFALLVVLLIFGLCGLCSMCSRAVPDSTNANQPDMTATPTPAPILIPTPTRAQSERGAIEAAVKQATGSKFRAIEINEDLGSAEFKAGKSGYIVLASINASSGFTENMTKTLVKKQVAYVLVSLFKENLNVHEATISVHTELIDTYGNTSDGLYYKAQLDYGTASKINWQADKALLTQRILPNLWTVQFANLQMRD